MLPAVEIKVDLTRGHIATCSWQGWTFI